MFRIIAAVIVVCVIALASTESWARARIRSIAPSKPAPIAAVQPKPAQTSASSRSGGVFVGVNVRPSAVRRPAAAGYAAHASANSSGAGPMHLMTDDKPVAEKKKEPVVPAPLVIVSQAEPKVEMATPNRLTSGLAYCYRLPSGGCAPF